MTDCRKTEAQRETYLKRLARQACVVAESGDLILYLAEKYGLTLEKKE